MAGMTLTGAARAADEAPEFTYSFNIGGFSDYMFRGFSQRDDKPVIQGGADIGYGMWYAGIWASNVDREFQGGANKEIDFYTGVKPVWGNVNFDFGVLYYYYPSQFSNNVNLTGGVDVTANYIELKASASTEVVKSLTGTVTYFYSPDYAFETGTSHSIEGSLAYSLPQIGPFTPTISALVGYQTVEDVFSTENNGINFDDIVYWNAGIALAVEKITFDMRYYGSNRDVNQAGITSTDDRFVFGAKVALP